MDTKAFPTDIQDCHRLIVMLESRVNQTQQTVAQQATELSIKDKLVEEQAHSVLHLKDNNDRLDEKVIELNLTIEKLLNQLYARKSEPSIFPKTSEKA